MVHHPVEAGILDEVEGDRGVARSATRRGPPGEVLPDQRAAVGFPLALRMEDALSTCRPEPVFAIPTPVPVQKVSARMRTGRELRLEGS